MNVNMANTHPSEYVCEWLTRNRKVTMFDQTILIRFTRRDCGFDNVTDRQSEMRGYKKCYTVPTVGFQVGQHYRYHGEELNRILPLLGEMQGLEK